eukprot:CAMPEP_0119264350 /NCGR_PEP_ID=MMETSP1329-20130426/3453_1 /TAXON_ID=114041 /ORGANISM="Genus nov. species nov., Strain RCC1024" /LENGTH=339 /DNA_ID=CAMNT_0007264111 /DNA_START=397 /DNA_END=1416 /DNA_ORIENTATION=+
MRLVCVEVQRVFRGHIGRHITRSKALARANYEDLAIFHYHAIMCQRTFRGYYSRRYRHDFNARKNYITSVVSKGDALRARLERARLDQIVHEAEMTEAEKQQAFKQICQHLHHLVSTKSVPGVYNSPYEQDHAPCALGISIEEHLCNGVKDLLLLRDYTAPKLALDLNGTKRVDVGRAMDARSLQASSPYDAPRQAARMEAKLGRCGFVGAADLRAGQRVHPGAYKRGVNDGSEFYDPWKNPYLQRGIPRCKGDLQHSISTLGKAPKVRFYTRAGGNMSPIHANGIFDVILMARKTGGVTLRHKVTSSFVPVKGDYNTGLEDGSLFDDSSPRQNQPADQ